jgi:DNA-binding NarL/FixJ family response regulator
VTNLFDARVLVVDDDSFTRTALEGLLRNCGFSQLLTCEGVGAAMASVEVFNPQLAIVDLDLGEGPNGMDLVEVLRRKLPDLGIVVLSTYASPRLLGITSSQIPAEVVYLVKSDIESAEVLLGALRHCWETDHDLNDDSAQISGMKIPSKMSDQHIQIMRLVAHGHSNAEIAERLVVSERTVEKSISRLIKSLNLNTDKSQNQRVKITQAYFGMAGLVRKI